MAKKKKWTHAEKLESFNEICEHIANGMAMRNATKLPGVINVNIFLHLIKTNAKLNEQYAHACKMRAENIFEDVLDIVDTRDRDTYIDKDGKLQVDHAVIQRDKLRYDARRWMVGKMEPDKYGDKIIQQHAGEIKTGPKLDLSRLSTDELLAYKKIYAKAIVKDDIDSE